MKIVADLHIHSKYSRAVSPRMEPSTIGSWAIRKGIDLVGTADWTHPLWLKELEASLEEVEEGTFGLKKWEVEARSEINGFDNSKIQKFKNSTSKTSQFTRPISPRFILSTEISSIYSQGGKARRIHNLLIAPSFTTVSKINEELKRRGCNLMSDGRPIIGLSSQQLCELVWSINEDCLLIPCHVWTPWFSLYGSKSGFDSIEECFGEYADRIYAIETGLSSDPGMNWRIKELGNRSIVSFSDAHSPQKLGREATVIKIKKSKLKNQNDLSTPDLSKTDNVKFKNLRSFSFQDLAGAIKQDKDSIWEIAYTIEFYPEEGKYHFTGHRSCSVKQAPEETFKKGSTCPVCGKPLTVGVMHRVEELSKHQNIKLLKRENKFGLKGYYNENDKSRPPYVMLVPLMEILAEALNTSAASQKTIFEYKKLTDNLAPEFDILMNVSLEKIARFTDKRVVEAIKKVRSGNIVIEPGYDGVFGVVKIWSHLTSTDLQGKSPSVDNTKEQKEQMVLF